MTAWLFRAAQCRCESQASAQPAAQTREAKAAKPENKNPPAVQTDPNLGTLFDQRYEVESLLGKGGMGSVYRVFDRRTGASYALKMIAADLAGERAVVKRLEYEAEATKALTHPNIVPVYEVGSANGSPYLVMGLVEGRSLDEVLQSEIYLPPERALNIFVQVVDGLAHAHSKGIIHRDLKPSNILLSTGEGGTEIVKLVDFGIAKLSDEMAADKTKLTQTGELIGSPLYMSPEQSQGNVLDPRSDIYSVGCVMYEVLAGHPPFGGDNPMQILFKHVTAAPRPLPKDINSALVGIVMRCLEKDPADRYANAVDLLHDLQCTARGKRIPLRSRHFNRRKFKTALKVIVAPAAVTMLLSSWALTEFGPGHNHSPQSVAADVMVQSPLALFQTAFKEGNQLYDMEDYGAACKQFQIALLHGQSVGEENQQYQDTLAHLAVCLTKLGKTQEAQNVERHLARVKRFAVSLGTIESNNEKISKLNLQSAGNPATRKDLCQALINQSTLYWLQGNFNLARDSAEAALKAAQDDPLLQGRALSMMVAVDTSSGSYVQADESLRQLMLIVRNKQTKDSTLLAEAYLRAGRLHFLQASNGPDALTLFDPLHFRLGDEKTEKQLDSAADELRCAGAMYNAMFGGPSPQEAAALAQLGACLMRSAKWDAASAALQRARQIELAMRGPDAQQLADMTYDLAELDACQASDRSFNNEKRRSLLSAADSYLTQAQEIYARRSEDTQNSIRLGRTLNLQGAVNAELGNFKQAEKFYKASIKIAARWNSYCSTAEQAYERLIKLYQTTDLPEGERTAKIIAALNLVQGIKSLPASHAAVDDLSKPIAAGGK